MIVFLSILTLLYLTVFAFTRQKKFGKKASGERLKKMQSSQHYKNGEFHNLSHTPALSEGTTYTSILKDFLFNRAKNIKPNKPLPAIKTDLHALNPAENCIVWFGHSSYFIQVEGLKILVDPVFSGSASPLPGGTQAFDGSNGFQCEDMPQLDLLLITHDHWDHLDYNTIVKLQPKVKHVITGLGTGAHLEYWQYDPKIITELDWHETYRFNADTWIHATPARHFSGRSFKRNGNLWLSFVLKTKNYNIFLGGDSGYDNHFADIGKNFGPFDIALLENGQYDAKWPYIHMMPEDFMKAAEDINSKAILPVHNSKFALSNHAWHHPLDNIAKLNEKKQLNILFPMIGEKIPFGAKAENFKQWWKNLE